MPVQVIGPAVPTGGPKVQVVRVKTPAPQSFILVCSAPISVWIHFRGRSSECTLERLGVCEKCENRAPKKMKLYLDAISLKDDRRVFLEFTPAAWIQLNAQLLDVDSCRGRFIDVSKSAGGAQGRYNVRLTNTTVSGDSLPEISDPLPVLRSLWNWGTASSQV